MRADCVCLDVNPAALASLRHHLSIGWLPGAVGGTARQFGDQIDGNERIVIVDEDDPRQDLDSATASPVSTSLNLRKLNGSASRPMAPSANVGIGRLVRP
jgi:hypothetical protein